MKEDQFSKISLKFLGKGKKKALSFTKIGEFKVFLSQVLTFFVTENE